MENWIDIKDAPGYEVSTLGQVRNKKTKRVLRSDLNRPDGYERVKICGKHRYIHRLMIENIYNHDLKEDEYIIHRDKNKQNNTPANLKIVKKNG